MMCFHSDVDEGGGAGRPDSNRMRAGSTSCSRAVARKAGLNMTLRPRVTEEDPADPYIPFALGAPGGPLDAILKWIPVEVIGAYQFSLGVVPADGMERGWLALIFLVLTAGWIAFATGEQDKPIAKRQTVLSTFAFAVWIVGTQASLAAQVVPDWKAWMGSIVLAVGWLLLPILSGILLRTTRWQA